MTPSLRLTYAAGIGQIAIYRKIGRHVERNQYPGSELIRIGFLVLIAIVLMNGGNTRRWCSGDSYHDISSRSQ